MVGFSGAVEDGNRAVGITISVVVAAGAGWYFHSTAVGLGIFVAGYAVATVWGRMAGARFRAQHFEHVHRPEDEDPPA